MPFNIDSFEKSLSAAFKKIKSSQAEALAIEISANYIAGRTAGEKHKSTLPAEGLPAQSIPAGIVLAKTPADICLTPASICSPINSADPEPEEEEDGLTTEEKSEIALLVALFMGYITKYNDSAQAQILAKAKEIIDAGGSPKEVQQYVKDVFEGNEPIKIDNVGKTKKEIYVDKDLTLSEVSKKIEKPFYASVLTYAAMTGENASHAGYEAGRKAYNISQENNQWVFVGPADEIARAWHVAILGQVYTYGTLQSEYAERCLREPRCRHRAGVYYGDERDVPARKWEVIKEEAGLRWDYKTERWTLDGPTKVKPVKVPVKKPEVKKPVKVPKVKKEKVVVKEVQKVEVKKTPEEVKKIMKDHEAKIKNNDFETAIAFDKNGNVLFNQKGKETEVEFSDAQAKLLKGSILTHNHPLTGGSFSSVDIKSACFYNINEMRVVDKSATYIMKLKNGGNFTQDLWDFMIEPSYIKHDSIVVKELTQRVRDGKTTVDKANSIVYNRIWTRVSNDIDILDFKIEIHEVP